MTKTNERRDAGVGDVETVSGQPTEEAEKNLTRNTTKDSSPPVGEEGRTSVTAEGEGRTGADRSKNSEQGEG